jgi:enoyl-CoA hydratase/carnithine racemase
MAQRWQQSVQTVCDGLRTITLNRPDQKNALSPELYREIKEGVLEGWADPAVQVLVLRGSGGAFASGGDLKHFLTLLDAPPSELLWQIARSYEEPLPFRTMLECPKPIVAVVDGICVAGGLVMAACSDHVIATPDSFFAVPEARVGLADPFCAVLLPRIVGDVRARHLMLSGRRIDAVTAASWGIVTELVAAGDLEDAIDAITRAFKANSPSSIAAYKHAMNSTIPHMSTAIIASTATHADGREGLTAFVERRPPRWSYDLPT